MSALSGHARRAGLRSAGWVSSLALAVLVGCAPPVHPKIVRTPTVSEALRSRLGVVSVTQLGGVPCKADIGPTDRFEAAMEGAGIGAGALGGASVPGIAVGTAAALVGGVAGAARAVPEETVREVEANIDRTCSAAEQNQLLRSEVLREAARTHVPNLQAGAAEGPVDTFLEIWVVGVDAVGRWGDDPKVALRMKAAARLVDARSNEVLFEGATFEHVSEPRRVSALKADQAALLEAAVQDAHRAIAAAIVDRIYDPVSSWGELRYGQTASATK